MTQDALGTGAQLDVGLAGADGNGFIDAAGTIDDDDDLLGAAKAVATANRISFGELATEAPLTIVDKDCFLVLTAENANLAADKTITGFVEYVLD